MKMKKFLASVLAALMAVSSMSFIASAQETDDSAEVASETVTITFNAQNGAKGTAVTTADVAVGEAVPFPADPTYIYHTFKGWSTEKNGTVIEDLSAVTASAVATYYGVWEWSKPDDGTPLDSITRAKNENIANENSLDGGTWYDAVAGVVYKTIKPKAVGSTGSANMYSGLNYTIPGTELYMVALVRTNMTDATTVTAGVYQTTDKSGNGKNFALSGTPITVKDTWQKVILKNTELQDFGIGIHIDYDLAGNDPADDLENDYYDMAGMALFGNAEDAEAWDIYAQNAYTGDAVISFDAQLTEDDDTDVYTEYPTNLENDGNALVGWTLDPTAEEVEYVDLTKVPVPTADVTYYAVWNEERTINFYKNDGTDAVETLTLGKGAIVNAPEFKIDGKRFIGWAESADGEIVEIQKTAEESKDYYAIWLENWLTQIVVNGNDYSPSTTNGSWYGIEDLATAEKLDFVMPYGYPTSIVPTIVPTAANGEAVYNAPATFDGEGSIVMGEITIPVTFTVADKDSVKDMTIVPTDTVNSNGRGAKAIQNNEDKGISALKVVPIYTNESEYYEAGKFQPERGTGVEGWGTFATHNIESYSQYRALVYYDDGGDGIDIDTSKNPAYIGISGAHTRGTFKGVNIYASNQYKTNRWEYVYFNIPDDKYGMTLQLSYNFFCGKTANAFKNDVLYVAEVSALVDADEKYLQYVPMGLDSTNETNAKNDGTITGVTADMEIAIGDSEEYTAVADFEGYNAETGVIAGLAPATYYVRYAGDDNYAPSEDVELVITPDSVEIYFEDGDPATNVIEQSYAYDAVITAPAEAPKKTGYKFVGWALEDAEEAYDFTNATATADLDGATFNALWERVTTFYVNGSAPTAGDGASAEAPLTSLADAWALVSDTDATIVITGNTDLKGNFHANGGNVTIKGATGEEVLTHAKPSFNGTNPGKIIFENLTIVNPTQWSNFWNFYGMEVEFGENITVPVDTANGKWGIVARAGGESGATLGRKIVLKSGEFSTFHLGSKGNVVNADVDFEFLGGKATINLGNDSVANQQVTTHGGTMQNIKARFEVQPVNVYMQWIHTMTGALQVIANNGVSIDKIDMNGVVPQGGTYIIHSAEGGRVDFTDTIGTYKFTTDKTYIVITDAEGNSTKYRAADGATGDANLYADETSVELALDAGRYNVTYTDEGVSVMGEFYDHVAGHDFELNVANNYSVTISETIIANAQSKTPDGYKFSGEFTSLDGTYKTVNGTLTVTEYTDETITLFPEYVEDDTLPYYHAKALYNEKLGTIDVTVSIANGKFEAGTVGGIFEKSLFEFAGYELAEGIGNNIGDAPAIVKDAMYDGEDNKFVLVWDAAEGYVDATEEDVDIVTFHFNVIEGHIVDIENIGDSINFYHPQTNYEEYFMDGHYLASAVLGDNDDPFAVNYVPVYEGIVIGELAPTDPTTVYVTVNMPDKAGATVDDIAYLAYWKDGSDEVNFIALEEAGNEETTITKAITDVFYVGETYNFTIVKNGYTGSKEIKWTLVETQNFETTLLGGDIKESFTGDDENAVDVGDFGDGDVTLADFVRVVRAFDTEATDEYKAVVDINEDGDVNVTDLAIVKANFGESYEDVHLYTSTNG